MADNISVDVSRQDGAGPPEPAPRTRNTCPTCNSHYREDEMVANPRVCTNCGHHFPVTARERIGDDIGLDVVSGEERQIGSRAALSNSFGFGGHNAALILAPVE